jgi:dienelactone hydrolase
MHPLRAFLAASLSLALAAALVFAVGDVQAAEGVDALTKALGKLDPFVTSGPQRDELKGMLGRHLRRRLTEANRASSDPWSRIATKEEWEKFLETRRPRLLMERGQIRTAGDPLVQIEADAVREMLRDPPTTISGGSLSGDGFRIEKLNYFSPAASDWVTANLYLPDPPRDSMPAILISHSHHNPKEQGELQDMGMTWARAGCAVLVPDHLGHGERRQHPFRTAADFDRPFAVGRQDYYFRYDLGMQLRLTGRSLMGAFVSDLLTGVSVLVAQKGVDPKRVILLGSVAGGGDPAAVAAAVDDRIACVVPFNFGGPQPETRYPLPDDAETWFNYAGSGSWESTRNLPHSAAEGFLPWVIVGSVAPRKLIYAHEFSWDRQRDPVWKRLEKIWGFYGARDNLAFTHGGGTIHVDSPEATHCNNIGAVHRRLIHEAFGKWFSIDVTPESEYRSRRDPKELACRTGDWQNLAGRADGLVHARLADLAQKQVQRVLDPSRDAPRPPPELDVKSRWRQVLDLDAAAALPAGPIETGTGRQTIAGYSLRRCLIESEPGIQVPLLLFLPAGKPGDAHPTVVCVASDGKAAFLRERSREIAELLTAGAAVCLADLRGCGETGDGSGRGQQSSITAHSATEMMLGGTMVGARLRDLRSVLFWLRTHGRIDPQCIALWGDSFTPPLPADATFQFPRRIDDRPPESDPMGSLVVLLAALEDEKVRAVYAHGGIVSYLSVLDSPFVQLPHDCVVPDVFHTGDLPELAASLAPRPVRLEGLVDGVHRIVTEDRLKATYARAMERYAQARADQALAVRQERSSPAAWFIEQLDK